MYRIILPLIAIVICLHPAQAQELKFDVKVVIPVNLKRIHPYIAKWKQM